MPLVSEKLQRGGGKGKNRNREQALQCGQELWVGAELGKKKGPAEEVKNAG